MCLNTPLAFSISFEFNGNAFRNICASDKSLTCECWLVCQEIRREDLLRVHIFVLCRQRWQLRRLDAHLGHYCSGKFNLLDGGIVVYVTFHQLLFSRFAIHFVRTPIFLLAFFAAVVHSSVFAANLNCFFFACLASGLLQISNL